MPVDTSKDLEEIYAYVGVSNLECVKRWCMVGRLLEKHLTKSPFAIMCSTSNTGIPRYKYIRMPLHDWIRLGGTISFDYPTVLECLKDASQ